MTLTRIGEQNTVRQGVRSLFWFPRGGTMWTVERSYRESLHLAHICTDWISLWFSREEGVSTFLHSLPGKLYGQDDFHVNQCNTYDLGPCTVPDTIASTQRWSQYKVILLCRGHISDSTQETKTLQSKMCALKELKPTEPQAFKSSMWGASLDVEGKKISAKWDRLLLGLLQTVACPTISFVLYFVLVFLCPHFWEGCETNFIS